MSQNPAACRICTKSGCTIVVPSADVKIVVRGLGLEYGRSLRWPVRELAAEVLHEVIKAGRLGDAPAHDPDWSPSDADVEDFGGPLANFHGVMRLWRAEEIGFHALLALGRAGRLIPPETVEAA